MKPLVTGGTGFLGSQLARIMVENGMRPVLLDPAPPRGRLLEVAQEVDHVPVSLGNPSVLRNAIKGFGVDAVFHLGGMLSMPSELDPVKAFEVNAVGTLNVLEAARAEGVKLFLYASSIAVYSEDLPSGPITDATLQRPATMYGATKVCGELLGRFYARRHGLDFRGLRIPSVVGPGSKVPHMSIYNCWAIEEPLKGKPYQIPVEPETRCPTIYFKDAARAFWLLAQADAAALTAKVYNIASSRPAYSAGELAQTVRAYLPQAKLSFQPDPKITSLLQHIGRLDLDDSNARRQWGWEPRYGLPAMVEDFITEFNQYRDCYI